MLGVKVEQVNAKPGPAVGGSQPCSFQLCVLCFGFLQDGDVGLSVFPEGATQVHCGRPTRRTRSWKRGSERRLSESGSVFSTGPKYRLPAATSAHSVPVSGTAWW